jgi:glyoxylase-like metal-dependent hydrolase (beta-lactamase superfamily II)
MADTRPPGSSGARPSVDTSLVTEVADGVHVVPDRRINLVPNIGIVVGETGALVVDTGMGPRNAEQVIELARKLAPRRRLYLTITHFHPEHGFGAQRFVDDAVVLYNVDQLDELHRKGGAYIELFRGFGPTVEAELEGLELVDPHITYEKAATIDLGGHRVRLEHVGPAHTAGDQTILVDDTVLFCGDLVEAGFYAIFPYFPPQDVDIDGHRWIDTLQRLENLEPSVVVPGHGEVGHVERIAAAKEYIGWVRDRTIQAMSAHESVEDVLGAVRPEALSRYAGWDNPEWIDYGVRWFYDHAESRAAQRDR